MAEQWLVAAEHLEQQFAGDAQVVYVVLAVAQQQGHQADHQLQVDALALLEVPPYVLPPLRPVRDSFLAVEVDESMFEGVDGLIEPVLDRLVAINSQPHVTHGHACKTSGDLCVQLRHFLLLMVVDVVQYLFVDVVDCCQNKFLQFWHFRYVLRDGQ